MDPERCDAIAEPNEYCQARTRCERVRGHDGPHYAVLGENSRRTWQDVAVKMNFIDDPFKVGETVYYLLPRSPSNGRPTDVYLECVVLSINKWVRIKPRSCKSSRNAAPKSLVRQLPEGAVVR